MKKLPLLLALLLLLTACAGTQNESPTVTPAIAPEPTPKPVPQFSNPSGIYADWTKLQKTEVPAEVGTRLSDEPLTTFTPSDDYGLLLPYVGGVVYGTGPWSWSESRYGLVTRDGCVVMDPVLSSVWTNNTDDGFVYVLNKAPDDIENEENPVELSAVCAADGSWCTDFIYTGVYWNGEYLRCYAQDGNGCLMDKNGNIVFELADIEYEVPLSEDYDPWLLQYNGLNYESGYVNFELGDGRSVYLDMEGKILRSDEFDGYCYSRYVFTDGGVAVVQDERDGFLGILGSDGKWVLHPDNGREYCDVNLQSGGFILYGRDGRATAFDGEGNVLCDDAALTNMDSPELCRLVNGWCISIWDDSNNTLYDLDMNVIAKPNRDTWVECYTGYAFVITNIDGKNGLMMYDGQDSVFVPGDFTYFVSAGGYVAATDKDHNVSVYDIKGKLIMEQQLSDDGFGLATDTVTGMPFMTVWENNSSYIIMPDGTRINDFTGQFYDGYYMVMDETGAGVKNSDGEYIFRKRIDFTD